MCSISLLFVILLSIFSVCKGLEDDCSSIKSRVHKQLPHRLSVCTMVHDEAESLQEWIEYHMLMSVDHFYIYNHGSTDNIEEVLQPYIDQGIVSLFFWENNRTVNPDLVPESPIFTQNQRYCIADCVFHHQHETQWMGVWDVDEFLAVNEQYKDLSDVITRYLDPQGLDGFQIPLTIFGPSDHEKSPEGLVIENYQWRMNTTSFGYNEKTQKFMGKSMYRSGCLLGGVHRQEEFPKHCNPFEAWADLAKTPEYPAHFNHYFTKSWEDYQFKMTKWDHLSMNKTQFDTDTAVYHEVRDDKLMAYVPQVKHAIECMNKH